MRELFRVILSHELTSSIDNGINIAAETAYSQQTDLSSRVRRLNPRWNEPAPDSVYDVCQLAYPDNLG